VVDPVNIKESLRDPKGISKVRKGREMINEIQDSKTGYYYEGMGRRYCWGRRPLVRA
jgi:hypothetical protein